MSRDPSKKLRPSAAANSQSDAEMTDGTSVEELETDEVLVNRFGRSVFDEQDPTERRHIREEYRKMMDLAQQGTELTSKVSAEDLECAVVRASEIYNTVKAPLEAAYDAEYLAVLSRLGKQKIQSVQTNFRVFEPAEFAARLVKSLKKSSGKAAAASSRQLSLDDESAEEEESEAESYANSNAKISTNRLIDDAQWLKFGRFVNKTILHAPSLKCLYGAFDPDVVEMPVAKQRKPRDPNAAGPAKVTNVVTTKTATDDDNLEVTSKNVQMVSIAMKTAIKKYGTGSVGYWQFVTHPTSFGKTVENMFYFSFLIKNGLAGVKFDDNELPIIYIPDATELAAALQSGHTNQFITNMDMETWRDIVETFQVTTAMIDKEEVEKTMEKLAKAKRGAKAVGK